MKFTSVILFLFVFPSFVHSQDLKRIRKSKSFIVEDYFVLKDDKNIRQGQYLRYYDQLGLGNNRILLDFGKYDKNIRTGIWLFFDAVNPSNQLITAGEYREGKKNGNWTYFYSNEKKDTTVGSILRFKKKTDIIDPVKKGDEFQVMTEIEGLQIASTGSYKDETKTGNWNYYSREGKLVYQYDYTANRMITGPDIKGQVNYELLGGLQRLKEILFQLMFENVLNSTVYQSSIASFDIVCDNGTVKYNNINGAGGAAFAKLIEKNINSISTDWKDHDPNLENVLVQVQLRYEISENKRNIKIDYVRPQPLTAANR